MRTGDSWTELYDEQSVDPLLYIDNSGCLDPLVKSELCSLLGYYEYKTPLYIRCMIPTCDNAMGIEELVIQQSRQCISIGSVHSVTFHLHVKTTIKEKELVHISSYLTMSEVKNKKNINLNEAKKKWHIYVQVAVILLKILRPKSVKSYISNKPFSKSQ
jgi:hypothetical protein